MRWRKSCYNNNGSFVFVLKYVGSWFNNRQIEVCAGIIIKAEQRAGLCSEVGYVQKNEHLHGFVHF